MLFLVRHGETEWNILKRLQGQKNIPLSHSGINQAKQLGAYFIKQNITFDHIYSSDLHRAHQTAEHLTENMLNKVINKDISLRERFYGELEGQLIPDIAETQPHFQIQFGVPMRFGMESLEDMQERMVSALTNIAEETKGASTLIVSHGGAINAFLHHITEGKMGTGKGKMANTSVTTLNWVDSSFELVTFNETPHLYS